MARRHREIEKRLPRRCCREQDVRDLEGQLAQHHDAAYFHPAIGDAMVEGQLKPREARMRVFRQPRVIGIFLDPQPLTHPGRSELLVVAVHPRPGKLRFLREQPDQINRLADGPDHGVHLDRVALAHEVLPPANVGKRPGDKVRDRYVGGLLRPTDARDEERFQPIAGFPTTVLHLVRRQNRGAVRVVREVGHGVLNSCSAHAGQKIATSSTSSASSSPTVSNARQPTRLRGKLRPVHSTPG